MYQVSSIAGLLLGISLLLADPLLSLNGWIAVLGFLLLGASGPFVFVFLGGRGHGRVRPLVRTFGLALPGLALASAGLIIWHLNDNLRRPVTTMLEICVIFGGVWLLTFAGWGIYQYEAGKRKRGRRHGQDTTAAIGSGSRKPPGSYKAQTLAIGSRTLAINSQALVIGALTLVATVFGDIIQLVR